VARRPAAQPEQRIGVLLYNPGGPAPATPIITGEGFLSSFSSTLWSRFDVVSWDPRGVSEGTEVDCVDDPEPLVGLDPSPETAEEAAHIEEQIREYADGCMQRSGDLLPHLSTLSTARDMDLLREALGEDQISYLGVSYGTALGSVYATVFPDRVRAAVLDGAFDLSAPYAEWWVQRAAAEDQVLTTALEDCAANEFCPFYGDGDPMAAFDELMVRLDDEPLMVDGAELGLARAVDAVWYRLSYEEWWRDLMRALADAWDGDGTGLVRFDDPFSGLNAESSTAIFCLDWPSSAWDRPEALIDAVLAASPRLGPFQVERFDVCSVWAAEPDPPPPLTGAGAGPILVVGSTGDIQTPLASSRSLAEHLEEGVLLVVERNAHGAYEALPYDSRCVRETVDRYLTDLELPPNGSRCQHGNTQLQPPS
jgi:pimeloyl-ACP methyl ester carboxylesterase